MSLEVEILESKNNTMTGIPQLYVNLESTPGTFPRSDNDSPVWDFGHICDVFIYIFQL